MADLKQKEADVKRSKRDMKQKEKEKLEKDLVIITLNPLTFKALL